MRWPQQQTSLGQLNPARLQQQQQITTVASAFHSGLGANRVGGCTPILSALTRICFALHVFGICPLMQRLSCHRHLEDPETSVRSVSSYRVVKGDPQLRLLALCAWLPNDGECRGG